ncbi:phosphoribosyltransferase [Marinobacter zhanjiangensis]|uniref:Hypoxanthine phosphoribosyltransferase n=1 Tax=Marinobacter zhanjiangensis TaxID=578215 RepID=A0ABQ3ANE4_9GAMM|nr:phosphoribosyltransferase family protein [Marinobacter zhanjiangensis]GGY62150.1 hypoxanthine phosphoribosyltransferase [Marinobacter zhanjiangensis]
MAAKQYLTAQGLLEDAFELGVRIMNSGFRPTFMIAVWRGGAPVGIAVQEFLDYHGLHTDHIAIRTSSYEGIDRQSKEVRVHGLNYLVKHVTREDALLIVDDVFDTGRSVQAIIDELKQRARLNTPHDIRVAVPYYKPGRNEVGWAPDFYLHETDAWLKYPHSMEGLTPEEIRDNRPALYEILAPHLPDATKS